MRRQRGEIFLLAALLVAAVRPSWAAERCGLRRLAIEPIGPSRPDGFRSETRTFTLEHWSDLDAARLEREQRPRLFPEPMVVLKREGGRCEIDGWIYTQVYASADEKTLVVDGHGGSESYVEIWEVATCRLRERIRVSMGDFRIAADVLEDDGACEPYDLRGERARCRPAAVYRFDGADCRPVQDLAESRRRTRERYGVEFDVPSDLAQPGRPEVRLLGPSPSPS